MNVNYKAEGYLKDGGTWCGKSYKKQRTAANTLHQKRNRYPHHERSHNALYHYETSLGNAVIEADEAEQKAGKQTVDRIGFQIVPGCDYCLCAAGEYPRKQVAVEKCHEEHYHAEEHRYGNSAFQRLYRTVSVPSAMVLTYKRCH